MIGGHGNNIYQFDQQSVEVDFSSNIAFNNRSSEILEELSQRLDTLCNYPDPMATRLTEKVADMVGVGVDNILITNGSAEAFYLVAHYLSVVHRGCRNRVCRTAITTPSFAEYEDSCRLHNHQLSYVELRSLSPSVDLTDVDSLWLASPNNPDGYRLSMADITDIARANSECAIILDRAYNTLSSEEERCGELPDNIIIIESFTKLYGIPGLRLGYIVASPEIVKSLTSMRPPWSVNALAIVAGEYIVDGAQRLLPNITELIDESLYLQQAITQIDGFRVTPSMCNFFLVEITDGRSASELYEYLLSEHRILIRDASNFRGLSMAHFRVAAQERNYNDLLISALQRWV